MPSLMDKPKAASGAQMKTSALVADVKPGMRSPAGLLDLYRNYHYSTERII